MDFNIALNSAEKLAIYQRCLVDANKILFERLLAHGLDPETFDDTVPTGIPVLDDQVAVINRMRQRVEELTR